MSIYDALAGRLSKAFGADGGKLSRAYALDGTLLWTAEPRGVETFVFSGPNVPWSGWKFYKVSDVANPNYSSTAEADPDFDDSSWESVTIPHDWSIRNDFDADSPATYEGGYLDGGDAWYRCHFTATKEMLSDRTLLYFDGVYMETTVWINGHQVAQNYHGYNPFWADVSNYLAEGANTLAVFVRNRQPSSRWYSGSGIYRPVYLLTLEGAGKWITDVAVTTPGLEENASRSVSTQVAFVIHNADEAAETTATVTLYHNGEKVTDATESVTVDGSAPVTVDLTVETPELWDIGQPNLYEAEIKLTGAFGSYTAPRVVYGYRWTKWDVDTGFWLNGKNIKLKGVCMHHDLGCIGAEANRSAMERQIDSMVAMGANAIRLTHNPSSTLFLDLCRNKGVLLVEELFDHWTVAKSKYDFARFYPAHYQEVVRDTLLRDRNNPAIIMWSLGNEINRTANYTADQVRPIVTALIAAVKALDTTRPVTMGEDRPAMDAAKVCMSLLDVCGINYNSNDLSTPHEMGKPSYGSETTSALASRGIYARDDKNYQCSSLDNDFVGWGSPAGTALQAHMDNTYSGGLFVWTGWDYIGEPTPFNKYPAKSSYFGIVDTAGFPKDIYYMYQSRWTTAPMLHIFPRDLDSMSNGSFPFVGAYSNCAKVELFVNGTSVGALDAPNGGKYQYSWWGKVKYTTGATISAKGYDASGAAVATDEVKTSSGTAAQLALSSYKPTVDITTDDLVFVSCELLDADGVPVPTASNTVTFACDGGTVLGTDNGNAACVEPMRSAAKSAFSGKVLCVCRHDGKAGTMTVTAAADGMTAATITVQKEG